jgi:UPF0755 protein
VEIKKRYLIPIVVVLLLTVAAVFGLFWWKDNTKAVSNDKTLVRFLVTKGSSAMQIANSLQKEGLIKSPLAFKFYVQFTNKAENIQAGEFELERNLNLFEVVDRLSGGPLELWVTVPEGLRREEVVQKFIDGLEMNPASAQTFKQEFLAATSGKEGYLFPDTYLFPRDATAQKVVDLMLATFDKRYQQIVDENAAKKAIGRDQSEVVVMASIIEREAKSQDERPIIAGILWKRLETEGWLMQADATLQYAIANAKCSLATAKCADWWPTITKADLELDSLYNSYKYKLLPPTPISNPGAVSLAAALYPEDSDYWFYIHDAEGNIHFSRSIEEHNANVAKYLGK